MFEEPQSALYDNKDKEVEINELNLKEIEEEIEALKIKNESLEEKKASNALKDQIGRGVALDVVLKEKEKNKEKKEAKVKDMINIKDELLEKIKNEEKDVDKELQTLKQLYNDEEVEEGKNTVEEEKNELEEDKNNKDKAKHLFLVTLDSCLLKLESFLKSFFLSSSILMLVGLCTAPNFGVISLTSKSTKTENFFISIALGRLLFYPGGFFLLANSLTDIESAFFFSSTALSWLLTCILSRLIFPTLTGTHYLDVSSNVEVSPSASDKSCIFLFLFLSNFISQAISHTCVHYCYLKFKPSSLPFELQENANRNIKKIFIRSVKMEGVVAFFIFLVYFLIIGIGSLSKIPNLGQNMDIFLFGYCFPFLKSAAASLSYEFCMYFSETQNWSADYTSKMTSAFSMVAVVACTLSQLYIVFRNANDYSYLLSQYLPHEVIKKLSWLTFHPLYLKIKMQVIDILSSSFGKVFKSKDKVIDLAGSKTKNDKKRFTAIVFQNIGATAGEIVGRQMGEDLCMILITLWMLPISQEFLFAQIYPSSSSSSSLPFPSYESVGVMIIGTAYGTETILTILCFVALQRIGIPLMSNRQVMEMHRMSFGVIIFTCSACMIIVAATFIY